MSDGGLVSKEKTRRLHSFPLNVEPRGCDGPEQCCILLNAPASFEAFECNAVFTSRRFAAVGAAPSRLGPQYPGAAALPALRQIRGRDSLRSPDASRP